jgi:hypothetical protein
MSVGPPDGEARVDSDSFLLTIAELSLAVVGFSAIVTALDRAGNANKSPYQLLLVRAMVEFGFAALLFALLPFVVGFFGIGDTWTLRLSNTSLSIFFFVYFPFYQRRRSAAAGERPATGSRLNFRVRLVVTYAIGIAALLSGWSIVPVRGFAVYALGISWLLFLAALGFLFTLSQPARD